METDAVYFTRRAREEREAAMKAAHPQAREAHLQLSRRYDQVADVTKVAAPRLTAELKTLHSQLTV